MREILLKTNDPKALQFDKEKSFKKWTTQKNQILLILQFYIGARLKKERNKKIINFNFMKEIRLKMNDTKKSIFNNPLKFYIGHPCKNKPHKKLNF